MNISKCQPAGKTDIFIGPSACQIFIVIPSGIYIDRSIHKKIDMHGLLFSISALSFCIPVLVAILKKFHQPYLVAYIMAGIIIGPDVLNIFGDAAAIEGVGELGVMLLMFFLGMEIDIPDRRSELITPVAAQLIKTVLSALAGVLAGRLIGWHRS